MRIGNIFLVLKLSIIWIYKFKKNPYCYWLVCFSLIVHNHCIFLLLLSTEFLNHTKNNNIFNYCIKSKDLLYISLNLFATLYLLLNRSWLLYNGKNTRNIFLYIILWQRTLGWRFFIINDCIQDAAKLMLIRLWPKNDNRPRFF